MCTVTYVPAGGALYFTSSRDEHESRKPALAPSAHAFSTGQILFPGDGEKGGSWIAAHENGNLGVLLNGALTAHQRAASYRKSRGLVLLDILDHPTPINSFLAINLSNIEPFTIILRDNGFLFCCRWDGRRKMQEDLDASRPHIWSSATLYDAEASRKREVWFGQWLNDHPEPDEAAIRDFHEQAGDGDGATSIRMRRPDGMGTVSVTLLELRPGEIRMDYLDLRTRGRHAAQISVHVPMLIS